MQHQENPDWSDGHTNLLPNSGLQQPGICPVRLSYAGSVSRARLARLPGSRRSRLLKPFVLLWCPQLKPKPLACELYLLDSWISPHIRHLRAYRDSLQPPGLLTGSSAFGQRPLVYLEVAVASQRCHPPLPGHLASAPACKRPPTGRAAASESVTSGPPGRSSGRATWNVLAVTGGAFLRFTVAPV
jgi:hypothetical protein